MNSDTTVIEMARANGYRAAIMDMIGMMEKEPEITPEVRRKIFNDMVSKSMAIELPTDKNLYDTL